MGNKGKYALLVAYIIISCAIINISSIFLLESIVGFWLIIIMMATMLLSIVVFGEKIQK